MLKERAASALKHGLPVPTPPPTRARVPDVAASYSARSPRSSSVPPSGAREPNPASRRMPLAVKFLGIGLLLLGVIYGLTLFRDHRNEADAALPARESEPAAAAAKPDLAPVSAPSVAAAPSTTPEPAAATTSNASLGANPLGADPALLAASLHVPSARPPLPAPSAAKPTVAAPVAQKMPSATVSASPVTPAPSAASPVRPSVAHSPAAAPKPVAHAADNPY